MEFKFWIMIFALVTLLVYPQPAAALDCKVMNNTNQREYERKYQIPNDIMELTQRQDKNYFQVFSCSCAPLAPGERVGKQTFGDADKVDLDKKYYEKDKMDWAESRLLVISNCPNLELSLGANDNSAIHKTVTGKIVLVVDFVDELDIKNLDVGFGATSSNSRSKVVAVILSNLVITQSRYDIKFEDKPLVLLSNVTFSNPVSLDIYNRDIEVNPVLKIVNCQFSGNLDITRDGLSPGSINKIRVENEHVGDNPCLDNSTAETEITGCSLGFLSTGDIEIKGGSKATFSNNQMDFMQRESLKVIDVAEVKVEENFLGFPVSLPPLQVQYSSPASGCSLEPIPSEDIRTISITGNQLTRAVSPILGLVHSYPEEEGAMLTDKIEVGGTAFLSPCSCAQTEADRNTTEGRLLAKEIEGARCMDMRNKMVDRSSYCGRLAAMTGSGSYPQPEPEPEPKDDSSSSLVLVGVLSGLLSALVAALVVGGACWAKNRHSSSSSPTVSPKRDSA